MLLWFCWLSAVIALVSPSTSYHLLTMHGERCASLWFPLWLSLVGALRQAWEGVAAIIKGMRARAQFVSLTAPGHTVKNDKARIRTPFLSDFKTCALPDHLFKNLKPVLEGRKMNQTKVVLVSWMGGSHWAALGPGFPAACSSPALLFLLCFLNNDCWFCGFLAADGAERSFDLCPGAPFPRHQDAFVNLVVWKETFPCPPCRVSWVAAVG